jgi:hypothetical protein
MKLKLEEVQRLCGIDGSMCKAALDALIDAKFLGVRSDGCYVRLAEAPSGRAGVADRAAADNLSVRASPARRNIVGSRLVYIPVRAIVQLLSLDSPPRRVGPSA